MKEVNVIKYIVNVNDTPVNVDHATLRKMTSRTLRTTAFLCTLYTSWVRVPYLGKPLSSVLSKKLREHFDKIDSNNPRILSVFAEHTRTTDYAEPLNTQKTKIHLKET